MKPVDHVTPTRPANWVRPAGDKRRRPETEKRRDHEQKRPPDGDADGRTHLIDELA